MKLIHGIRGWGIYDLNRWGMNGICRLAGIWGWGIYDLNGWGMNGICRLAGIGGEMGNGL